MAYPLCKCGHPLSLHTEQYGCTYDNAIVSDWDHDCCSCLKYESSQSNFNEKDGWINSIENKGK